MNTARRFIKATREFSLAIDRLQFGAPVRFVYNPLSYARVAHETYLQRYLHPKQPVLFLGMNPGPFGMAQTGVPFGEVSAVRDWLGIQAVVRRPPVEHPRKPVLGFACPRSEVSGRRLWSLFAAEFGTPQRFFARHFVSNYCPVLFLDGGRSGRNLTPENLPGPCLRELVSLCDRHLQRLIECCGATTAVGIGNFAASRLEVALQGTGIKIGKVLHPSPASPAANRDWQGAARRQLRRLGIW